VSTDGSSSVSVSGSILLSYAVISSISKSEADASSVKSPAYGMRTSISTAAPLKSPVARLPQISSSGCVGAGVVGLAEGLALGDGVGDLVGFAEGMGVGSGVGFSVGDLVGLSELHRITTSNMPVCPSSPSMTNV